MGTTGSHTKPSEPMIRRCWYKWTDYVATCPPAGMTSKAEKHTGWQSQVLPSCPISLVPHLPNWKIPLVSLLGQSYCIREPLSQLPGCSGITGGKSCLVIAHQVWETIPIPSNALLILSQKLKKKNYNSNNRGKCLAAMSSFEEQTKGFIHLENTNILRLFWVQIHSLKPQLCAHCEEAVPVTGWPSWQLFPSERKRELCDKSHPQDVFQMSSTHCF